MTTYLVIMDIAHDVNRVGLNVSLTSCGEFREVHDFAWLIKTTKWSSDVFASLKPFAKCEGFISFLDLNGPARLVRYSVAAGTFEERPLP